MSLSWFIILWILHVKIYCFEKYNWIGDRVKNYEDQAGINNQQSEKCRDDETTQCLSYPPMDQYSVYLGDKVEMNCTVRNLHGKVQWRARTILLGWDRDIPSQPRFRIIGNEQLGENTLQITGVKASDIGEYECQVAPSGEHPLLRRKTNLEVLISPEKPRIHESPNSPAVETIIINKPYNAVNLNLICRAKGGNPPPMLTWLINGEPINGDIIKNGKYLINGKAKRYEIEVTPGIDSDEIKLQINRAFLKDGDEISCKAWNKAIERVHTDLHALVTTAVIRIHTEIGDPQILNDYSQEIIRENDTLKVTCTANPAGNPTGNIHWQWELNESLQKHFNPHGFNRRLEDISPTDYKNSVENNILKSELVIRNIHSRYHGATLVCLASHHLTKKRKSMKILIFYPPKYVTIETSDSMHRIEQRPDQSEQVINARMNATIILKCYSDWFYKNARLRWILSPDESIGRPEEVPHEPAITIDASDSQSFYLESQVRFKMLKKYNGGYIDCQSWYGDGANYIRDSRVRLNIIYAPEIVRIDEYNNGRTLQIGSQLRLTCRSIGGNPKPTLSWYINNKKTQENIGTQISNLDSQILTIDINITKEMNGKNITCKAYNSENELEGVQSEVKTLNVLFPPSELKVRLHGSSGQSIAENELAVIECSSAPSNPEAELKWTVLDCRPDFKIEDTNLDQNLSLSDLKERRVTPIPDGKCVKKEIDGVQMTRSQSEFGGTITKISYEFNATWEYSFYIFNCEINAEKFKGILLKGEHKIVLPSRPQLLALTKSKEIYIQEGKNFVFDSLPLSNASDFSISWFKNGVKIKEKKSDTIRHDYRRKKEKIHVSGMKNQILIFEDVDQSMAGTYNAEATNEVGTSYFSFDVIITRSPKIKDGPFKTISINENSDTISLEFQVDGVPPITSDMILWTKKKSDDLITERIGNQTMEPLRCYNTTGEEFEHKQFVQCDPQPHLMTTYLTIYNLNQKDMGVYECIVDNGVGVAKKTFYLTYPITPHVKILEMNKKSSGVIGAKSVVLKSFVIAEPLHEVTWSLKDKSNVEKVIKKTKISDIGYGRSMEDPQNSFMRKETFHYQTFIRHSEPGLYEVNLNIFSFTKEDFGTYKIQAGPSSGFIEVVGTSSPYMPINFKVTEQHGNSIRVQWTQAFNGGDKQIFQLKWREAGSATFQYQDIVEDEKSPDLTYTINNLKGETSYEISISSRNELHGPSGFTAPIHVKTNSIPKSSIIHTDPYGSHDLQAYNVGNMNENAILIIVAVCVFGFVVLVINLLIISFLVKRRKKMAGLRAIHSIGGYGNDNVSLPLSFAINGHGRNTNGKIKNHHFEDAYTLRNSEAKYFNHPEDKLLKNSNYLNEDSIEMTGGQLMNNHGLCTSPNLKLSNNNPTMYDKKFDYNSIYQKNHDDKKTFSGYETGSDDTNLTVKDMIKQQTMMPNDGYYFDQNTGQWKNDNKAMISLAQNSPTLIRYGNKVSPNSLYMQKACSYEKGFNQPIPAARNFEFRKASVNSCYHQFLQSTPQLMSFGQYKSESISNLDSPKVRNNILKRNFDSPNSHMRQPLLRNMQNGNKSDGYSSQDDPSYEKQRYRERLRAIESERKKTSKVFLGNCKNDYQEDNQILSDCSNDAVSLAKLVRDQGQSCLI